MELLNKDVYQYHELTQQAQDHAIEYFLSLTWTEENSTADREYAIKLFEDYECYFTEDGDFLYDNS